MTTARPFRFGVLCESVRTRSDLVRSAARAEALGYATFLIRDHFIDEPFGPQLGPLATLATVASITKTLRVGSLVFCNDYRHPVELAKEAATIDLLSGGRLELGVGAGFTQTEYERSGRILDPGAIRAERLEESVDLLKALLGGTTCTFSGKHYAVRDLDIFPKPLQLPHPPILIGGSGRRMLSIAARNADIIGIQTVSTAAGVVTDEPRSRLPATVSRKIRWIRDAAGDRFANLELSTTILLVLAHDRQSAADTLARTRGWIGSSANDVLTMPSVFIGNVERIVDEMRSRRELFGMSYFIVSDRLLDDAAPIVAALAGT